MNQCSIKRCFLFACCPPVITFVWWKHLCFLKYETEILWSEKRKEKNTCMKMFGMQLHTVKCCCNGWLVVILLFENVIGMVLLESHYKSNFKFCYEGIRLYWKGEMLCSLRHWVTHTVMFSWIVQPLGDIVKQTDYIDARRGEEECNVCWYKNGDKDVCWKVTRSCWFLLHTQRNSSTE